MWSHHTRLLLHAHDPEDALAPSNEERRQDEDGGAASFRRVSGDWLGWEGRTHTPSAAASKYNWQWAE